MPNAVRWHSHSHSSCLSGMRPEVVIRVAWSPDGSMEDLQVRASSRLLTYFIDMITERADAHLKGASPLLGSFLGSLSALENRYPTCSRRSCHLVSTRGRCDFFRSRDDHELNSAARRPHPLLAMRDACLSMFRLVSQTAPRSGVYKMVCSSKLVDQVAIQSPTSLLLFPSILNHAILG